MGKLTRRSFLRYNAAAGVALAGGLSAGPARAADAPIRVGFLMSFTGPSAINGPETEAAIKVFVQQNGDSVAGRKIEILFRDTTGPSPEVARRVAQDLVLRDKVDLLAGVDYTPAALAVMRVSTDAKIPFLLVNAGTSGILTKSPYTVRFGFTVAQICSPLATWMPTDGVKKIITVFSDFGPGLEAGAVFRKDFVAAGGEILSEIRIPVSNPDFSGAVQRIKDAKPQAIFVFLPAGEQPIAFFKAVQEANLMQAGIRIFATGDVTNETVIDAIGAPILGITTTYFYSDAHPSAINQEFVKRFGEVTDGKLRPIYVAAITYDIMGAIYALVKAQNGTVDPDKTMEFLKGYRTEGPRGPLLIDPETRDAVQNVYLRRTERVGNSIVNTEFKTFPMVKSPKDAVT